MGEKPLRALFVDEGRWPEPITEGLWVEKVGDGLYRLLNIPFYAYGYSFGDIVRCEAVGESLCAVGVVNHSGSSTVRLLLIEENHAELPEIVSYLEYAGCAVESHGILYAFDVPPEPQLKISMRELAKYLNELETRLGNDVFSWEAAKWMSEVDPASPGEDNR